MALCFWFGFRLYLQHHITSISTIVIVLMSVMMLAFSISQTAGPIIAATKAASAAADFFATIDAPSTYILSPTIASGHAGHSNSLFTKCPKSPWTTTGSDHTIVSEVVGYPNFLIKQY